MTQPEPPTPPFEVAEDFAQYLTLDPVLDRQRLTVSNEQLTAMVVARLVQRGLPAEAVERSRFVWTGDERGAPQLCVILPGPEA